MKRTIHIPPSYPTWKNYRCMERQGCLKPHFPGSFAVGFAESPRRMDLPVGILAHLPCLRRCGDPHVADTGRVAMVGTSSCCLHACILSKRRAPGIPASSFILYVFFFALDALQIPIPIVQIYKTNLLRPCARRLRSAVQV